MDSSDEDNSFWARGYRKCIKEPLVPFGAFATVLLLRYSNSDYINALSEVIYTLICSGGLRQFRLGNKSKAQVLMRGRVAAQAFTLIAMGVGVYLSSKPKERTLTIEEKLNIKQADVHVEK